MHVVHGLEAGGLENGVVNLCNRLDQRFEVCVCVLRGGGELEGRLDQGRVDLFEVRRWFGNDPSVPLRLARLLRQRGIDILHTHCWVTLVEGMMAAKLAGVPIIIHGEHGLPLETRPRNVRVQRWLWPRAAEVTAVCGSLADRMTRTVRFPRERVQVIPNGVDTHLFRSFGSKTQLRLEFGIPADGRLIGTIARLDPIKNHAGLLHAATKLKRDGFNIRLAAAGGGPLRRELEQLAQRLGIGECVHFLGEVAKVERIMNALDVFVLNSLDEGMSNAVLEAMACGLPVVATSVGENPVAVTDGVTGRIVPPDDTGALATTLAKFVSDPAFCERLGAAGRRRVTREYSIEKMVNSYSDLYLKHASVFTRTESTTQFGPQR